MITAGHRARMIQVAARLGIADILARGPADSVRLAAVGPGLCLEHRLEHRSASSASRGVYHVR